MLLRQDRFHIHPILCAKIVQGERKTEQTERKMKFTSIFPRCSRFYQKRKELVHFLFPSRSLYYQKIVQGERKRKELVHFLFPSRSLYYQKIVQGERKTEQTERKMKFTSIFPRCSRFYQKRKELVHFSFPEPQPILSHIRNFRKIKNFSKRYYSLRSGTTTSSTTASGFGCDTSFFGLSRWSGNVYATDKLTFK